MFIRNNTSYHVSLKFGQTSLYLCYSRKEEFPLSSLKGDHVNRRAGSQCCINDVWVFKPHVRTEYSTITESIIINKLIKTLSVKLVDFLFSLD